MARLNEFLTEIDLSVMKDYIADNGILKVYAKGDMIVREGEVCRYLGIVKSGYFKYTALNSNGNEVVTGFAFSGDIVTDYVRSFLFDQPAMVYIVAGCEAEVLIVSVDAVRRHLKERLPHFVTEASSRLLHEAYRRYLDCHVKSPSERYHELVTHNPDVTKKLPVNEVASYLGISRRHLNRIRKAETDGQLQ